MTNYGLTIAYSLGIFERALEPFPAALEIYRTTRAAQALKSGSVTTTMVMRRDEILRWLREEDETRLEELWQQADDTKRERG